MKKFILSLTVFLIGLTSGTAFLQSIPTTIGATIPTSVALFETSLANAITDSATTMTLVSATTKDGTTLSGEYAFIIDEGTSAEEFVLANCTGTACSGMTRGVSVITGTSSISILKKSHRRGASVKITDAPQLLILSRIMNGDETFPNILRYSSSPTITGDLNALANVAYVNALTAQGVATSTENNFGGVWLATQQQMASSTYGGVNKPYVMQGRYATSSPSGTSASGLYAVISKVNGKISQLWLDLSEAFTFSGPVSLTGTTTLSELTIGTNAVALTASTTINGATTPVPVYIASSTNANAGGVFMSDANDINALDFVGFSVSNAATGTTVYVQKDGIVNGFTGLTKGTDYFVQDTLGTIGTTTGTYVLKVGKAVSATEILVDTSKRDNKVLVANQYVPRVTTSGGTTQSTSYVKLGEALVASYSGTVHTSFSVSTSNGSYNACGRIYKNGVAFGTEHCINTTGAGTTYTEVLSFSKGDLIQLYAKMTDGSYITTVSGITVSFSTVDSTEIIVTQ